MDAIQFDLVKMDVEFAVLTFTCTWFCKLGTVYYLYSI